MAKIYLKSDWTKKLDENDPGRYFSGRTDELNYLRNLIETSDNSTVLLGGRRGSGKTSLVNKLLTELKGKVTPIKINASHAALSSCGGEQFLVNSITRALYEEEEYRETTKELFKKTLGNWSVVETKEKSRSANIMFGASITAITAALSFLTGWAVTGQYATILIPSIVFIVLLLAFFSFRWQLSQSNSSKETMVIDNSFEHLIHELRTIITKVSKSRKLLIIIDELDKTEIKWKVFAGIKEFLNTTKAHFLFITDQSEFNDANWNNDNFQDNRLRHKESTLFTHTMYLSEPRYDDILTYFRGLIDERTETHSADIDNMAHYLIIKSRMNMYDLKRNILENLNFDNSGPFIDEEIMLPENVYQSIEPRFYIYSKLAPYIMKWDVIRKEPYSIELQKKRQEELDWLINLIYEITVSAIRNDIEITMRNSLSVNQSHIIRELENNKIIELASVNPDGTTTHYKVNSQLFKMPRKRE